MSCGRYVVDDSNCVEFDIQVLRARGANRSVSRAAAIRKYAVVDEPLTLESGMVTPTTKVRRGAVLERFADRGDQLYAER